MTNNISFSIGADNNSRCVSIAKEYLAKNKYSIFEYGTSVGDDLDWVEIAKKVSKDVQEHKSSFGILFCYTGTGVTMVANKFKGIRAALCNDEDVAAGARKWNDANILAMGTMTVKEDQIESILAAWIDTKVDRLELKNIKKIDEIEL
jgi:ribose 5-phosphate isomerase B|tara:strand:- start:2075 stop:2518 length:444 start_codon:yes stop_codon:yes gene_type:complete